MNAAHRNSARKRAQVPLEAAEREPRDWYSQCPDIIDADAMAELYRNRKAVGAIDFVQPPSFGLHPVPMAPRRPERSASRGAAASLALFALLAIGGGSATGYLAAHPEFLGSATSASVAGSGTLDASPFASLAAYAQRLLPGEGETHRAITTSVRVKDVTGPANTTIPLGLDTVAESAAINYRISGVPEAATLTSGLDLGSGDWIVKAKDISQLGLVADHRSGDLSLRVTALAEEQELPDVPVKELTVTVTEADPIVLEPPKKKGQALAKLKKKIEPMQAEGDPGVTTEDKEALEVIPAAAPPPQQFPSE